MQSPPEGMYKYVNPANAITASRFFTLPAFVVLMGQSKYQTALLVVMLCGFLDLFDGMAARKFNCSSGFGEMFDAAADGICYGFMLAYLAWKGYLPYVPILGIVVLGVINTAGRLGYAKRIGRTTNYRSWAMERVVAFTVYLVAFGTVQIEPLYFSWACFGVMAFILVHDLKRMLIDPVPA